MVQAVEAVTRMLDCYPNAKNVISDGYMGAIAAILCKYPRQVVLRGVEPTGIPSTTSFIPTAADVIKWLEREQLPYRNAADWQRDVAAQLAERKRFEEQEKAEPLEHRRKVAERIKRKLKEAFQRGDGLQPNVFVPSSAPQYRDMVARAEREPPAYAQYGHSLEDKTRYGIWVPLEWLSKPVRSMATWQQFTNEELLAIYGRRPTEDK